MNDDDLNLINPFPDNYATYLGRITENSRVNLDLLREYVDPYQRALSDRADSEAKRIMSEVDIKAIEKESVAFTLKQISLGLKLYVIIGAGTDEADIVEFDPDSLTHPLLKSEWIHPSIYEKVKVRYKELRESRAALNKIKKEAEVVKEGMKSISDSIDKLIKNGHDFIL
jgi:hypothetical protein